MTITVTKQTTYLPLLFKGIALACSLLLSSLAQPVYADNETTQADPEPSPGITIEEVSTLLDDGVYYLDAQVSYVLSEAATDALGNGVELVFAFEIEILKPSWGWWNEEFASLAQRYSIRYHALSRQYVLNNINTGEQSNFKSLEDLTFQLGNMHHVPLLDRQVVPESEALFIKTRARLEIDSLPIPLRPVAYFSSEWRLKSDWSVWPLND